MIREIGRSRGAIPKALIASAAFALTACSGLLPSGKQETQTPWRTYAEAQQMYEKIVPGTTQLTELKALGVDPEKTPNVAYLGHTDTLRRLIPASTFDIHLLDPGLQKCVSLQAGCFAYEIEQLSLDRQRFGNFWLDFFNFKREINVTGWQFDAVFVIKNDTVVFKHWSGKPSLRNLERESSPLGPFQSIGPTLAR